MLPNLINPVMITLRKNLKSTQHTLDAFKEPTRSTKEGSDIEVQGQPQMLTDHAPLTRDFGLSENVTGYIIFRQYDLDNLGIDIERSDHIVQIGTRATDFWITEVRHTAYYTDQLSSTLVMAFFHDRSIP